MSIHSAPCFALKKYGKIIFSGHPNGNISICTDTDTGCVKNNKSKKSVIAKHLPTVSVCNIRSFFPKQNNWKNDFFEHQGDVSLLCEVWQKAENRQYLELNDD